MLILPVAASFVPDSTRHMRQLATTGQPSMPAVVRNFDAGPLRGLDAVQALGGADLDFLSVNNNRSHASWTAFLKVG